MASHGTFTTGELALLSRHTLLSDLATTRSPCACQLWAGGCAWRPCRQADVSCNVTPPSSDHNQERVLSSCIPAHPGLLCLSGVFGPFSQAGLQSSWSMHAAASGHCRCRYWDFLMGRRHNRKWDSSGRQGPPPFVAQPSTRHQVCLMVLARHCNFEPSAVSQLAGCGGVCMTLPQSRLGGQSSGAARKA